MPTSPLDLAVDLDALRPESRLALAAYLVRYRGHTLRTYSVSLSVYVRWCVARGLDPLDAERMHLELFIHRHLEEERHLKASSISHHLTPICGFYKFCVLDGVLTRNPALLLRLPKVFRDPLATDYLTEHELRATIAAARRSDRPSDQGLTALLAIHGLRIQEALGVAIEDFATVQDGHRVLLLIGKGGRPATIPLTVASGRMLDAAAAGRAFGPLLLRETSNTRVNIGAPLSYRAARVAITRLAHAAGIERRLTPHMFRRGWVTNGLRNGVSLRQMQIAARHSDPRTTSRYDRGEFDLDRHAVHAISASLTDDV